MSKIIKTRIQHKHDLEVNWQRATFVPLVGELIIYDVEVDSDGKVPTKIIDDKVVELLPTGRTVPYTYERFKIGDGITPVNDLPFILDPYYTKAEVDATLDNLISCGAEDPSVNTTSKFYLKYSTN